MPFILIVEGKEARSGSEGSPIIAHQGKKFLVIADKDSWVEATSWTYIPGMTFPTSSKIFPTKEAAEEFASRWKGHPWWCIPSGKHEILEVTEKTETVVIGYEPVASKFLAKAREEVKEYYRAEDGIYAPLVYGDLNGVHVLGEDCYQLPQRQCDEGDR
jgi:hypothetical protein